MSHGSEESENYWPGYVDALTSMVQVLAFVMMLLAMAVFVLSQSVSKGAVEAIARAAGAEIEKDASLAEITGKLIKMVGQMRTPEEGGQPAASPEKATPLAALERMVDDPRSGAKIDEPVAHFSERSRIVIRFSSGSYVMPSDGPSAIQQFVAGSGVGKAGVRLSVRAYASPANASLSEARRLAYYRAMTVRKQILENQVAATEVQVRILDTPDEAQGLVAEVAAEESDTK